MALARARGIGAESTVAYDDRPVEMRAFTIDLMTEADLDAVLAIDLESFHPNPSEKEDPRDLRRRQLSDELVRPFGRLRVARGREAAASPRAQIRRARTSTELLGYVLFWHVTDEIHLLNVAVAKTARRGGVGRALVEEVIAFAHQNKAAKILLEVRASNHAAIALYEGLGFSRFNVREKYYFDLNDRGGEDGIEMVLTTTI